MEDKKTLDEIAYSIIDTVRPIRKDDDNIDIRDVYDWIDNARIQLFNQRSIKNPFLLDTSYFQQEKVEFELLPKFYKDDNIVGVKSKDLSNVFINSRNIPVIRNISYTKDFINPIKILYNENLFFSYIKSSRFERFPVYALIKPDAIILGGSNNISLESLKEAYITAVFSHPRSVSTYNKESDRYPISQEVRNVLERMIISERFGIEIANYSDKTNDESHNLSRDVQ